MEERENRKRNEKINFGSTEVEDVYQGPNANGIRDGGRRRSKMQVYLVLNVDVEVNHPVSEKMGMALHYFGNSNLFFL